MHKSIQIAALMALDLLGTTAVFAQNGTPHKEVNKQETVVIRKDSRNNTTVVEIKNGTIYVNGDPVMSVQDAESDRVHKKVIIADREANEAPMAPGNGWNNEESMDAPTPPDGHRKAMLGVMTDARSQKVGAVIKDVNPGSAAEKAGLQAGDVITRVDGKTIKDANALVFEISGQHEAGDKVNINYLREGREHTTAAVLESANDPISMRSFRFKSDDMNGDMPNGMFKGFPFLANDEMTSGPKLGVNAEDRADGEGVTIMSVKPGSAAANSGLRTGDVVTRIGSDKVSSVDELQMSLRTHKAGDRLQLEYLRDGQVSVANVLLPRAVMRKDL